MILFKYGLLAVYYDFDFEQKNGNSEYRALMLMQAYVYEYII